MKKLLLTFSIVLIVLGFCGCGDGVQENLSDQELTQIAKCLTEKNVKMYGAVWCAHCQKQKKAFGDAFEYINYIECDANTNIDAARECVAAGIDSIPAWDFPDGTRKTGEIAPSELAKLAGC